MAHSWPAGTRGGARPPGAASTPSVSTPTEPPWPLSRSLQERCRPMPGSPGISTSGSWIVARVPQESLLREPSMVRLERRLSCERLQPGRFDLVQFHGKALTGGGLVGGEGVTGEGQVDALVRIRLQVVHLPLVWLDAAAVVVAGDLVPLFADADDAVGGRHKLRHILGAAQVVVGEDDVVL